MKAIYVDQFGKTSGRESLALANLVNEKNIQLTAFIADTTEIPADKHYDITIKKGFHGAYVGNALRKAWNYLRALHELKRFIQNEKFDIIHLQWFSLPWIEWIYVKALKKYGKIIVTVHDVVPFDNRPLEMKCLNLIYKQADRILIHTEKAKQEFHKYYTAKTPISVITQAFSSKADYPKYDKEKARAKLGVPQDAVVFLFYGTIRPSKGLDLLMKAVLRAQEKNEKIYLLAAGAFHKVDEAEYRALAEEVSEKGAKINFGFVPFEMEKYYFSAADVLALPYLEGTQSGVVQLGLIYELPIIASDIYAMDDVAKKGENALRFPVGDVTALSNCIVELADDSEERSRFEKASKSIGEKDFSLENKAKLVKNAYVQTMQ